MKQKWSKFELDIFGIDSKKSSELMDLITQWCNKNNANLYGGFYTDEESENEELEE